MTHMEQTRKRIGFGLAMTMVWGLALAGPTLAEPTVEEPTLTGLAVAGPTLAQHAHQAAVPYTTQSVTEAQRRSAKNQWGIDILGVRMTAAGHMLDFRYRVLDTTKAGRLIHPKMGLLLIDQENEEKLPVPMMENVGALQQTRSHLLPDRTYSVLFANQSGKVKIGSKVAIELGELKLNNLVVE